MTEVIKKSRLILPGYRNLGSLIYLKGSDGRLHLKFSFKNKIGSPRLWLKDDQTSDITTYVESVENESTDISYKFSTKNLEVKFQQVGGGKKNCFVPVPFPFVDHLFYLKVGDIYALDAVSKRDGDLVLSSPTNSDGLIIIFSFPGIKGKPFTGDEFHGREGNGYQFSFRDEEYPNSLYIGVIDDHEYKAGDNLLIAIKNRESNILTVRESI